MNFFCQIAVLITCFNRKEKTLKCLANLYEQAGINESFSVNIFLVDDNSTDGTADAVSAQFPEVNLIKGTGNLYWNRGMHLAWQNALEKREYDFFLWLNDDTILFKDAIKEMLGSYYKVGENALVCGTTCSERDNTFTYGGRDSNGNNIIPNGTIQQCIIMNGNCVLISNKICKSTGIIDNLFPHAIGDHDYGLRAIKKGFDIVIPPGYIGFCEGHERLPMWCLPDVNLKDRIKSLYSPLGNSHPYYFFIYENRHFGFGVALKHYFSIHLRALIPSLWR